MDRKLTKMEEQLSPREKAALVFSLEGRGEWDRADRVEKSVPMGIWRIRDLAFVDRSNRLWALPFVWGSMHWQQVAIYSDLKFRLLNLATRNMAADVAEAFTNEMNRAEGRLVALDSILDDVCTANGVDAQAVRKLADVDGPYKPAWLSDPEPEFVVQVRRTLSRLAE
jgi:hypothetical protein